MLLEALIGILVFTIGIVGLMGMQTAANRATADMKYRSEAALFAEQIVNQMWADDHSALETSYASPGGPKYVVWRNAVSASSTGLPGSTGANFPTVVIVQGAQGPNPTSSSVSVTVRWQGPGEAAPHQYQLMTSIPPI